ncbi:hypothetical protein L6452_09873 [Arctium lappa]|uniref:Uncharacterized protein n=1 Tax=Arctium lappa TaxID=4217 RepID=A0ACB9DM91_ARCLA|nr:hypothetical protein L6452_09873 [Arctium lappa]
MVGFIRNCVIPNMSLGKAFFLFLQKISMNLVFVFYSNNKVQLCRLSLSLLSLSRMFEFGDELIIESYRIPWLIWIQLLAMFLLVILLYYFTTTPDDLSLHFSTATAAASPSATGISYNRSLLTSAAANNYHNSKVTITKPNKPSKSHTKTKKYSLQLGVMYFLHITSHNRDPNCAISLDRENEIKETGTSTSEVVQRTKKPDGRQREGSSTGVEHDGMMFEHSHHPCHFFGLAKQAFLKCLGFDSSPENPTRRRHEKDD